MVTEVMKAEMESLSSSGAGFSLFPVFIGLFHCFRQLKLSGRENRVNTA
jgi:hypothetical protein